MTATFRPRKYVLYVGIGTTLGCAVFALTQGIIFLKDGPRDGFGQNPTTVIAVSAAFTGFVGLLSSFSLAGYFISHISFEDTQIHINGLFRKRHFDAASVHELNWNERASGGKLVFLLSTTRYVLRLDNYSNADRLAIIRIVRKLVPLNIQTNWDGFCHFVAVPLCEGRSPRRPGTIQDNPSDLPESSRTFITRARYDRSFAMLFILSAVIAGLCWRLFADQRAVGLPVYVVVFWALLRFSCPKHGSWQANLTATPQGRLMLLTGLAIPGVPIGMLLLRLAGVNKDLAAWGALAPLVLVVALTIRSLLKQEKLQRARDAAAITDSLTKWNHAEALSRPRGPA